MKNCVSVTQKVSLIVSSAKTWQSRKSSSFFSLTCQTITFIFTQKQNNVIAGKYTYNEDKIEIDLSVEIKTQNILLK